ncbi:MAG: SH3 domain-containing protein [Eubacteriales bacterium]|nr:SH3 domain-containing protein [Eubacteriales bacterium]
MQKTHLHKRCLRVAALLVAMALPVVSLAESYKVVKGGSLNLRQEASTSAKVLGQYPTGTWMTVIEEGTDWTKVKVNGVEGYVMSKYLADASTSSTMYVRTNTGVGLNLRTAPSLEGDIITSFPNGTAVNILSRGNGWYKIQVGDSIGFAASRYLSTGATSGGSTSTGSKQGVVNNPGANQVLLLRETASTDARVLGYYRNGTVVTIKGESGSFYKVTVNGQSGYMMKSFIKLTSGSTSVSPLPEAPFAAKLVNPNGNSIVNFRTAASYTASIIKAYPVGTEITVTEVGDVWCRATIGETSGYVSRYFFAVSK